MDSLTSGTAAKQSVAAKPDAGSYKKLYLDTLLHDVIPFWQKYSIDREAGGYFSCLDRDGRVFEQDKFMWLQARQVWTFAMLYNRYEKRPAWLDIARHGIDFLTKYGMDDHGNWYFALNRQGQPLVQPYNIFSDCFASLAFSEYARATGDEQAKQLALKTYQNIHRRSENPKGIYNKTYPNTRPLRSLGLSMILCNLTLEMRWLFDDDTFKKHCDQGVNDVMDFFLDRPSGLIYEHVAPDGTHPDCFDGRLINPGHSLETMWFIIDILRDQGSSKLIDTAVDTILTTLEFGWDKQCGGIFYFMDAQNKPPQQLEWDQKLWWVHLEALLATLMAYVVTGRSECWQWYEKLHHYTWKHFPDPQYGEWFGYLDRQGQPFLKLKGGKWKGCFHVPRGLFRCYQEFALLEGKA